MNNSMSGKRFSATCFMLERPMCMPDGKLKKKNWDTFFKTNSKKNII